MNVLLINDTRAELNPGCQATVSELITFVKANGNDVNLNIMAHGESYEIYKTPDLYYTSVKVQLKNLITRIGNKLNFFNKAKDRSKSLNFKTWKHIALNEISEVIKAKIANADLVLVNMEGTIHNNGRGGLALLGLAYYAKSQGKKVAMVNGSYQNMSKKITLEVLSKIEFLSVREVKSYNYLKRSLSQVHLIPDFAFKANINEVFKNIDGIIKDDENKKCLYTVGVLGAFPNQKNGINLDQITQHVNEIKQLGYKPYYLKIENAENAIETYLKDLAVNTISYNSDLKYANIGTLISKFDLLVTGRYHIGIFGLMSKVKTLFLPSNTYKIEGLLKMINREQLLIENDNIISSFNASDKKEQIEIDDLISMESYNNFGEFLRKS